jgi:hypothetical protein
MANLVKFTTSRANVTYVTSKGVSVNFVGTQALIPEIDAATVAELKAEADAGHPHISYDANDLVIDEAVLADPLFLIKERWLAEQKEAEEANQNRDVTGDAVANTVTKPASTADLIAKAQSNAK